jgi:high-affinity iron transporter
MGSVAVVVMATLAVGREGLETAFFFFAAIQAASETVQPLVGFLIGIGLSSALSCRCSCSAAAFAPYRAHRYRLT